MKAAKTQSQIESKATLPVVPSSATDVESAQSEANSYPTTQPQDEEDSYTGLQRMLATDPEKDITDLHDEGILPISPLEKHQGRFLPIRSQFVGEYLAGFHQQFKHRRDLIEHLQSLAKPDDNGYSQAHVLIYSLLVESDLKTEAYLFLKKMDLEKEFLAFSNQFRLEQRFRYKEIF